jgi:hypothetical protein
VHLICLSYFCLWIPHYPVTWKEAKTITLLKPGKHLNCSKSYFQSALVHYGQTILKTGFKKYILKHTEGRSLLNKSRFALEADHSTTLQCVRLEDRVTADLENDMLTAAVLWDTLKAFYTRRRYDVLYKLSELEFCTHLLKLIDSFFTDRKFKFLSESEFSTPRTETARVPHGSIFALIL